MEIVDQRGQASDVIFVGVRQGDHVHGAHGAGPEIGRDYVFADIELRTRGVAEGRDAAAIHQHALSIGEGDQQAVALADIDGGQFQLAGFLIGGERMQQE